MSKYFDVLENDRAREEYGRLLQNVESNVKNIPDRTMFADIATTQLIVLREIAGLKTMIREILSDYDIYEK